MVFIINKVLKNLFSTGASNIISQLLLFLVGTYYAKVLGTEIFGSLSVVQSILMYFSSITLFGLQTYGLREVSKNKGFNDTLIGEIITFRLLVALASYIVLLFISLLAHNGPYFKFLVIFYGLTLFPVSFSIDWYFNGLEEMHHNAVFTLVKNLIPTILIFVFLKTRSNVYLIPISTILGLIAAIAYQFYVLLFKKHMKFRFKLSKSLLVKYNNVGLPFLVSGVLAMVNNYIDRIIMGFTRTQGETGIYASAYFIIMFLINIVAVIFTPLFPLLIRFFYQRRMEHLKKFCDEIGKCILILAIPISLGGILLAQEIILLLFHSPYYEAYKPLMVLMIYILLMFVREIYGYQLNAWHKEKVYLKIVALSAATNFTLNIIFTPRYGMVCAAWITVASEIVNLVFMRLAAEKVLKTKVFAHIPKVILPASAMVLSIVLLKHFNINVVINIITAVVVYGLSLLSFKSISISEFKMLFSKEGA